MLAFFTIQGESAISCSSFGEGIHKSYRVSIPLMVSSVSEILSSISWNLLVKLVSTFPVRAPTFFSPIFPSVCVVLLILFPLAHLELFFPCYPTVCLCCHGFRCLFPVRASHTHKSLPCALTVLHSQGLLD